IIAKSLGLEVGGSVGLPLYLSQALAVAMYVFGFREGWNWLFPEHSALVVDLVLFAVIFIVANLSTSLAFRIQYVVMVVILVALVLVLSKPDNWVSDRPVQWWGELDASSGQGFWMVFAVFFPAATGVMAGANMSGELENPRRNIPLGTLSAIAVSTVVYFVLTLWASRAATPEELTGSYTIMIDRSWWGPGVVFGLLGATFSSALSSLVGAPRILMALGRDRLIPGGEAFGRLSGDGEPRRALFATGAIVLLGLLLRDLNVIAPLITMFFLITYAVINLVMLVESTLGLVSFRPTLRLPLIVPLLGVTGCTFAMFIVNPTFSLVAWGVVLAVYIYILKAGADRPKDDVRSGLFVAFAEWAAGRVTALNMTTARAWKPNVLVPVSNPAQLRGEYRLLRDLVRPEGSIKLLGLASDDTVADVTRRVSNLGRQLRQEELFTTWSVIDTVGFTEGIVTGMQALGSAFFHPNLLVLTLSHDVGRDVELLTVIRETRRLGTGLAVFGMHAEAATGRERVVNLWVRPPDVDLPFETWLGQGNLNLAILLAYRLARSWTVPLNLISVVADESDRARAEAHLEILRDLCRIPRHAISLVMVGELMECLANAPQSDMDVLGLPKDATAVEFVRQAIAASRSSCIFTQDSGNESAVV
ncbi:MAG: amino acid permease, partial [Nannocystaceae bacterium]